jgi:ABC-type multidrug transport system ATPase subunit
MFRETEEVRKNMGVCPQHDVLLDLLTPNEHLDLFFELKNGNPREKQK